MTGTRTVWADWEEGLRCRVQAGRFELTVDEPIESGGTDEGPQPTELLLASVASCFTLAMAYVAARDGATLNGLQVEATGHYAGPRYSTIRVTVRASGPPPDRLDELVGKAERVCYVTNTLRRGPDVEVVLDAQDPSEPG